MTRPTVGLVMIVKNESVALPRLAESLKGHIDHWTIVDTGSTDNTIEVAKSVFGEVPGEVVQDSWRGFGPSRNVAVEAADPHTDWLLHLDPDHRFHGEFDAELLATDADAITVEERYGILRCWLPRLTRSGRGWRYYGRTHEYLAMPDDNYGNRVSTDSVWVEHLGDGGSRSDKFERDAVLLGQDWADKPGDARTAFYLGRTYDEMQRDPEAIEWYRNREMLGGWDEEIWYSRYRRGACLLRWGAVDQGCGVLWDAWNLRPWRAEPLVTLAEHYRLSGQWQLAWQACLLLFRHTGALPYGRRSRESPDVLFGEANATAWRAAYEASIAAWYVNEPTRGVQLCDFLLGLSDLPGPEREAVEKNRLLYPSADDVSS